MKAITDDRITRLLAWYDRNRRFLPWREDREPYHVWLSEIMLQQTRIEAVLRYYQRFIQALPDVRSLSEVGDDVLLKLWEGLGYYSRARNLKKAAQVIVSEYGGEFPRSFASIRRLPGIGDYTAGAIASICFGERVPAVDGNVLRVLARLNADRRNVLLPQTKKDVSEQLRGAVPARAGDFNEALMELGEVVCLPNGMPLCADCPLRASCKAYQGDLCGELPVRIKEQRRRIEELTVFILRAPDGRIALQKRPDAGLLSGMYELPNVTGRLTRAESSDLLSEWGLTAERIMSSKSAKHIFTHIEWRMTCCTAILNGINDRFIWAAEDDLSAAYPLPTAFRKLLK